MRSEFPTERSRGGSEPPRPDAPEPSSFREFFRRAAATVALVTGVALVLLFFWLALDVLALVFTGILLAVFLRGLAGQLERRAGLPHGWSLAAVSVVLLGAVVLSLWGLFPALAAQFEQLRDVVPEALAELEELLGRYAWGRGILDRLPSLEEIIPEGDALIGQVSGIFSTTFGALISFLLILFVGIYLSVSPDLYRDGILKLFPMRLRPRMREVYDACGHTLRWWLLGRALSMLSVGIMATAALLLLGVPLAVPLGILAAVLDFVPNIGPIIGTIPAALIALTQSPTQALYVLILYTALQQVESYLITPIVQQRTVSLPPALTVVAQVIMTILIGAIGLLIATPIVAVFVVIVRLLYVEDVLGDRSRTVRSGRGRRLRVGGQRTAERRPDPEDTGTTERRRPRVIGRRGGETREGRGEEARRRPRGERRGRRPEDPLGR